MASFWIQQLLPSIFCVCAFLVNPIFVYLIFSGKSKTLGNYRYLLLYFALFNLVYSVTNVLVPLDIHSYSYCFFVILSDGFFVELSNFHTHLLAARCSLISCSYAVLLSHFIYRYLVVQNSSCTREKLPIFFILTILLSVVYFGAWHMLCVTLGNPNNEIREYIDQEFQTVYSKTSMEINMIATLYQEASPETLLRSWIAVISWTTISFSSILAYFILAILINRKLNKISILSRKKSKLQFELLRALVVQTGIPIVISFSPCLLCWFSPMFGVQLARWINHLEVSALGVFAFPDPIAIILCVPIFRKRLYCRSEATEQTVHS